MGVMNIDDLKEDMVLSDDVTDITGRLLLQKGQKLRPNHVNIMKKWGVTEVSVVDDANDELSSGSNRNRKETEQIEQEIIPIFKYVDLDHPAIKELFRLSVLFRKEQDISEGMPKSLPAESIDIHEVHPTVDVREKISQNSLKLPEIPNVVFELNDILSDPLSTADSLAQVVAKSPSLTAALLKIVNSSFYGFSSKIDTISRAVTIIGTREISSLALVICTITVFKNIPREILGMRSFLKHSFACGLLSRMMAANRNIQQTEQLFVAGLLHDIGRVIIYKYFPEQAKALLTRCMVSEKVLHQEEHNFLGCNHTDVSRYVLQEWNFPPVLENNIFYHHNPMAANDPVQASIVHLADIIVNGLGIGSSGEKLVPPLDTEAWELLGLPPSSFEVIINQASHQLTSLDLFLQE
ncbi:MAG: HDOD domain-containing protein [Deltaproteobacteria bacterium]|nr:HDOD domain-containing protein [Deltaproteobacteria bacterium]MBW2143345.1 HDOD domain-containing protein [Deltaproteobacteria bacterium]